MTEWLPNERRHFVHKRLLRGIGGLITGGPGAAIGGLLTGDAPRPRPPARRTVPRVATARPTIRGAVEQQLGRTLKFTQIQPTIRRRGACTFPARRDPVSGQCRVFLGDRPGRDTRPLRTGPGVPGGDVVMGRHGAGMRPGSVIIDRADCTFDGTVRGMILGNDGICYNKGQIKNSERMWPRGRRPLLTGGDMRAISIASRAANKLTRTAVRLHEIGLIKKPIARKPRKKKS